MKIERLSVLEFRHKTNTVRDSDGHGHPGPESDTTSALLTITADDDIAAASHCHYGCTMKCFHTFAPAYLQDR